MSAITWAQTTVPGQLGAFFVDFAVDNLNKFIWRLVHSEQLSINCWLEIGLDDLIKDAPMPPTLYPGLPPSSEPTPNPLNTQ